MYTISYGVKGLNEEETDIRKQKPSAYATSNSSDHWMFNEDRD